jgi:hypothetical protein
MKKVAPDPTITRRGNEPEAWRRGMPSPQRYNATERR